MARITDPKCRICRRLGEKLFLKGSRCDTPKCAIEKRSAVPGQHGIKRVRLTDYGIHLREVQRAKRMYGVLHRQFRRYFQEASRRPGNTGEYLLQLLERRLDNILYRLGLATSRSHARQMIVHGHVNVNGKKVHSPSHLVSAGDVLSPRKEKSKAMMQNAYQAANKPDLPSWLKAQAEPLHGAVVQLPTREELQVPFNEQLIVEFMAR